MRRALHHASVVMIEQPYEPLRNLRLVVHILHREPRESGRSVLTARGRALLEERDKGLDAAVDRDRATIVRIERQMPQSRGRLFLGRHGAGLEQLHQRDDAACISNELQPELFTFPTALLLGSAYLELRRRHLRGRWGSLTRWRLCSRVCLALCACGVCRSRRAAARDGAGHLLTKLGEVDALALNGEHCAAA